MRMSLCCRCRISTYRDDCAHEAHNEARECYVLCPRPDGWSKENFYSLGRTTAQASVYVLHCWWMLCRASFRLQWRLRCCTDGGIPHIAELAQRRCAPQDTHPSASE
jgi:hypothetical protein